MAEMLWGFGGVKLVYGTTEMELPHCYGKLGFQELKNTWRTKSGNLKVQHKGFIPVINITMWNLGTWGAGAFNMSSLIQMLNAAKTEGIMVYPRYEYSNDLGYLCILNSDISPEDFSQNVAAGQTLELSFIGKQKIDNMPTYTTWEGFYYMVDFYDNYLIDHNGNNLILKG